MAPKIKSNQDREHLRKQILDAARSLFVERGIEAVSMREIAKKINYSATTLYNHFADKDALLQAVCDNDFLALTGDMQKITQIPDLIERLKAFLLGYAHFALQYPNHYRLMFMTPRPNCDPDTSAIEKGNAEQDGYALIQQLVQAVFAADLFRADISDCELLVQTLWAGMHGVCSIEITLGKDQWVEWTTIEERLNLMLNVMLRGLLRYPDRIS
ncbi:TetR/AcrR family transcriptional regulator [Methylomonas sp. AM2-LC]|uniref:TetR/AcrR family transcriptional regulator n=1 Tax=Methylomonas sp. AM2-LC TaxID=3153301 RepID=UPI003266A43C